jgi:hypothetical protein
VAAVATIREAAESRVAALLKEVHDDAPPG